MEELENTIELFGREDGFDEKFVRDMFEQRWKLILVTTDVDPRLKTKGLRYQFAQILNDGTINNSIKRSVYRDLVNPKEKPSEEIIEVKWKTGDDRGEDKVSKKSRKPRNK